MKKNVSHYNVIGTDMHQQVILMKRMTQRSLAKELHLSERTLYRVINGEPGVQKETRLRVIEALNRGGYSMHGNLLTRTILVDRPQNDHYMESFINDLVNMIAELHFKIRFSSHTSHLQQFLKDTEESDVLIFFSKPSQKFLQKVKDVNPNIFIINVFGANGGDVGINADNFRGCQAAARYLLRNGHHNAAIVALMKSPGQVNRYKSFIAEYEFLDPDAHILRLSGTDPDWFSRILNANPRPTALFCTSGIYGFQAYRLAQQAGLRVPEDLSILNCDRPEELGLDPDFALDTLVFSPDDLVRLIFYFLSHRPLMGENSTFDISLSMKLEKHGSVLNLNKKSKNELLDSDILQ